jgi:ribosomal-protein-alanine N-acetyltransferase
MELQTERLQLQELALTDLPEIHQLHSIPEVDEFNTLGIPETIQVTEALLSDWIWMQKTVPRMSHILAVKLIGTGQFIGLIALNVGKPTYKIAEVWYKIHPDYWRKGYTTEALTALLKYGFRDLGLHRIEAGCAVENTASIRVLEKAGMTREGRKRQVLPIRGQWIDNYFYSVLESDFEQIT